MAILIIFNNFFHDFTAALWVAGTVLIWYLRMEVFRLNNIEVTKFYKMIFPTLIKTTWVTLFVNLILGVFRALNYYNFEYLPAQGKGQVEALIIKHVLIFGAVGFALLFQIRLWKEYQSMRRTNSSG